MSDSSDEPNRKSWHIFKGYRHRREVFVGKDPVGVPETEMLPLDQYIDSDKSSRRYQRVVYKYASKIHGGGRVLDIGCGIGYKTIKFFRKSETLGLEIEPTLSLLREKYPHRCWEEGNLENLPEGRFPLVICADVIEHIIDPDDLLNFIGKIDFSTCVMSTPDRDTLNNELGLPRNSSHLREWSFAEFGYYIAEHFQVMEHFQCREPGYKSQVVVFRRQIPA
ncbi:MAG: methyltransferase domain-containing protein [Verrucomicrobiales bacterium]